MAGVVAKSSYLQTIGEKLEPEIHILWTGPEIVSETISVESIRELQEVIRRKPVIWDNLHANDYDQRRIYLGPYSGRPQELRNEVAGILSNPNCEFEANFVPLRTLAMYAQAIGPYDPRKAYSIALNEWIPEWRLQKGGTAGPITSVELELLGDCFYLPHHHGRKAEDLLSAWKSFLQSPPAGPDEKHHRPQMVCSAVDFLFERMSFLENRDLLYAFYRHLWTLKEELHLLQNYLDWLCGKPSLGAVFTSAEHRSRTYRGGFLADLQRLLPMDAQGRFNHRPPLIPPCDSHGSRTV